jgi:catechol 2,3-dioxygenase-like lactoylglutathione lyase family enzyme
MKRLHVHVGVNDLAQSIRFYSTLFAAEPTVRKITRSGCSTIPA